MPDGGLITIHAENTPVALNGNFLLSEGEYVRVTITDQGVGIPEEHLPKIFDPFFSTKERGSGLGLASAFSIMKKHGGHITVDSFVGRGTTFSLYLPASRKKQIEARGPEGELLEAKGKILVMDDEEIVREIAGEMLKHIGYEVEFAGDGAEAIARYAGARESGEPFQAIIMDLTVPGGMGGKEAIRRLLEIDPGIRAIVSSGYSNDPVMSYKIEELSEALRKAMPWRTDLSQDTLH